jgi:putative hemolysin
MDIAEQQLFEGLRSRNRFMDFLFGRINALLKIDRLNGIYTRHKSYKGLEFVNRILGERKIEVTTEWERTETPAGFDGAIIISNHPHGILDGLVLLKVIGEKAGCPAKVIVNHLMEAVRPLEEHLIPVNAFENSSVHRLRVRGVQSILREMKAHNSIIVFPAGDVSEFHFSGMTIKDKDWNETFIKLMTRNNRPVVPVYISGRNSFLYYVLTFIHPRLGLVTLVNEFFRKKNTRVHVKVGKPVTPADLEGKNLKAHLRELVDNLR